MTPSQGSMTLNQTRIVNMIGHDTAKYSLGGALKGFKVDQNTSRAS